MIDGRKNTVLEDISALIGFTATLRLVAWYGSGISNVYVPDKPSENSAIAKLIGLAAAKRLADEFGGQWFHVPSLETFDEDVRRRVVCVMFQRGYSTREVARDVGLSVRRVQQIRRELEEAKILAILPGEVEVCVSAPVITGSDEVVLKRLRGHDDAI